MTTDCGTAKHASIGKLYLKDVLRSMVKGFNEFFDAHTQTTVARHGGGPLGRDLKLVMLPIWTTFWWTRVDSNRTPGRGSSG